MVHSLAPWSTKHRMETVFGNIDNNELAVRLGSINTFDRRGDTVWMDDFEAAALRWSAFTSNGDGSIKLNTEYAKSRGQSCKMTAPSGDGETAYMYKYLPLPRQSKIGFECSFTRHADISEIIMEFQFLDGTNLKIGGIICSFENNKLYYYNSVNAPIEFHDSWIPLSSNYLFNTAKIVIDYATTKYMRAIVNDTQYDLSAYSYKSTGSELDPYLILNITVRNTKAGNPSIYVDDVIITQNEP